MIHVHNKKDKCISPKVLDLHENKLTSLPEDIGKLTSLQVQLFSNFSRNDKLTDDRWYNWSLLFLTFQILNVEKNRLTSLPPSIGELRLLQTLNLKGMMITASSL